MNGHDELVQILLDKGLEIDDQDHDNSSSLHLAAVSGKTSTAKILISKGAGSELEGLNNTTPLLFATCYQKIGVARFLLQHGANVNAVDRNAHNIRQLFRAQPSR